jgi:membrane fusion protein, macrolide-specific efflux system
MKKKRSVKIRNAIILAIILVATLFMASRLFFKDKPPEYVTAAAARSDIENAVLATGALQASRQVDVGAQVSGQLKALRVKLGDQVKKGQLLAEIDPTLSKATLDQNLASLESLEAQRRSSEANLRQAGEVVKRQQAMLKDDATPQQTVDEALTQRETAAATLASLAAQIKQARSLVATGRANLAYTQIVAPIDGEVVAIVTEEGQTVVAAQQVPVILKLANLDTMLVKAQVSEADVIRIRAGQKSYFTVLGDAKKKYFGALRAIEPAPQDFQSSQGAAKNSGAVFYNAVFDVPNAERVLRIGMTAQVAIVINEAKVAITIPAAALGQKQIDAAKPDVARYEVRVLSTDGKAETKTIKVGINNNVKVEVLEGLAEGEKVITSDDLKKGAGDNASSTR